MKRFKVRTFNLLWVSLAAATLLSGCLKDKYKPGNFIRPDWEPGFGLPLATVNIKLANLLENDSTLNIDSLDQSVGIVFKVDTIASQDLSDVFEVPAQAPTTTSLTLGAIEINDFGTSESVELSDLTGNLDPATGAAIDSGINSGFPIPFPPIPEQSGGVYTLPAITEFGQVLFSKGGLRITIQNGYQTTLDSVVIELSNSNPPSLLGVARFGNITANDSASQIIPLAGLTMQNTLDFGITKISSAGTGLVPAPMSDTDALVLTISGDSLEVIGGSVKIPSQEFDADTTNIDFATTDNEEIYTIELANGDIDFNIVSSIATQIVLNISMPTVTRGGNPINDSIVILPNATTSETISLAGATIDLTNDPNQPFNIFPVIISARLDSSVGLALIDSSNRLDITTSFGNIDFNTVLGYFGQKNIDIDESIIDLNLSFLKDIGGSIFLANPTIKLDVTNSIGAPIELTLNMEGRTIDGQSVGLNAPAQVLPFPASPNSPPATGPLQYDRNNSQLPALLSMPPDTLISAGRIVLNPQGNQGLNFVTNNSSIFISLEADLPFELSASDIAFGDTIEFNAAEELNGIVEAKMRFRNTNGFPFDMDLELIFLDNMAAEVHRISAPLVLSGQVDATGRVTNPTTSLTEVLLARAAMPEILKAEQLVFRLRMSTSLLPSGDRQVVKIYTDYDLQMKLGLEATVRVGDLIGN